jgi:hypothetical protein
VGYSVANPGVHLIQLAQIIVESLRHGTCANNMRRKLHFVIESKEHFETFSSMIVFVDIGRFQHLLKEPSSHEKVQQGEWNSEKPIKNTINDYKSECKAKRNRSCW